MMCVHVHAREAVGWASPLTQLILCSLSKDEPREGL